MDWLKQILETFEMHFQSVSKSNSGSRRIDGPRKTGLLGERTKLERKIKLKQPPLPDSRVNVLEPLWRPKSVTYTFQRTIKYIAYWALRKTWKEKRHRKNRKSNEWGNEGKKLYFKVLKKQSYWYYTSRKLGDGTRSWMKGGSGKYVN